MIVFFIEIEYVDDAYSEIVGYSDNMESAENYCTIENKTAKDESLSTHYSYFEVIDINKHGDY